MTRKAARDTRLRCGKCGHTTPLTTKGMAEKGMRRHACERNQARNARSAAHEARQRLIDRTPKECDCPQADHAHGTYAMYVRHKCRCLPCCAYRSEHAQRIAKAKAYGRFSRGVDPAKAREHIAFLRSHGMGAKTIARKAGVSESAVGNLIYGKKRADGSLTPITMIFASTEERILSVRIELKPSAVTGSTGTQRRLQALMVRGWSIPKVAAACGFNRQRLDHAMAGKPVLADTVQKVKAAYDQMWDTDPPAVTKEEKSSISRSKGLARRRGWHGPLAWDEETIDDPAAEPYVGKRRTAKDSHGKEFLADDDELDETAILRAMDGDKTVVLTRPERAEVIRRLVDQGLSDEAVGARLGTSDRTILRLRQEHGIDSRWAA